MINCRPAAVLVQLQLDSVCHQNPRLIHGSRGCGAGICKGCTPCFRLRRAAAPSSFEREQADLGTLRFRYIP